MMDFKIKPVASTSIRRSRPNRLGFGGYYPPSLLLGWGRGETPQIQAPALQITAIQVMAHAQVRPLPLVRGGLGWGLSPVSLAANLFILF
jgi:hypothetical protein